MMENEESEVCENETNSALPSMGSKRPFSAHNDGAESLRSESDSNDCPDSNGIQSSIDNMDSDATSVALRRAAPEAELARLDDVLSAASEEKARIQGMLDLHAANKIEYLYSISQRHEWFPSQVNTFLTGQETLTFSATATTMRRTRLRQVAGSGISSIISQSSNGPNEYQITLSRWQRNISKDNPASCYDAYRWQTIPTNAGSIEGDESNISSDRDSGGSNSLLRRLPSVDSEEGIAGGAFECHLTMTWQDQGWGNRKGMVFVVETLPSDPTEGPQKPRAPGDHMPTPIPPCVVAMAPQCAPHFAKELRLSFRVKKKAEYALWYRVGGGGGHRLVISDCRVFLVEHCTREGDPW